MPSPINTPLPVVAGATTVTGTTETVVATSSAVTTDQYEREVLIICSIDLTVGSDQTSITLKVRQGTGITGTTVGTFGAFTAVSSNRVNYSVIAIDNPANYTGQYVLTVTQAGGTANGTSNHAALCVWAQALN